MTGWPRRMGLRGKAGPYSRSTGDHAGAGAKIPGFYLKSIFNTGHYEKHVEHLRTKGCLQSRLQPGTADGLKPCLVMTQHLQEDGHLCGD